MNSVLKSVIKKISNQDINVKKNYKLLRFLQDVVSPSFLNKDDYRDVVVSVNNRNINCRVFEPQNNSKKLKTIVFIHGGGWATGSISTYTKFCTELSKKTHRMIIAIDYRLAPEYRYPAGFDDCYDVVKFIMDNLENIGLSQEDVCLMGDSAGGNLVAAIVNKTKITKDFEIKQQILLYPSLQMNYSYTTKYKSVIENGKDYLLTRKQLQDYVDLYLIDKSKINDIYVSPLNKKICFGYPKTMVITADKDPLRDEGKAYAKKLKLFFNKVTYYNFKGAMHGFLSYSMGRKYKEETLKKILKFLGDDDE